MHSYGVDALAGAKLALSETIALRVDGVWDWLANEKWKTYESVRVGLSVFRRPDQVTNTVTRTVTVMAPAPAPIMLAHEDSVSAAETRRLRDRDVKLRVLRDSLALPIVHGEPRGKSQQNIPIRKDAPVKP